MHHLATLTQRDRNRVGRQTVDVVRGAIQGSITHSLAASSPEGEVTVLARLFGKKR